MRDEKRTGQLGQAHCPGAQVQLPVVLQLQVCVACIEGLLLVSEEAEPVVGPLLVPVPEPEFLSAMVLTFFESMSDIVACGLWVVWWCSVCVVVSCCADGLSCFFGSVEVVIGDGVERRCGSEMGQLYGYGRGRLVTTDGTPDWIR